MAAPSKRRGVENENIGNDQEISINSDDDMEDHVDVDFQAFPPTDADFHGIKALLHQIFLKANIDLTEVTNAIIAQNYVGNVLKTDTPDSDDEESDDTVFAAASVINITEKRRSMASIETMVSFVCDKCDENNKLREVLNDSGQRVGWVICERFINIPPQAAVPMLESLLSDMQKACEKKMAYTFDWFLMVCKCYRQQGSQQSELFFTDPEQQILQKYATQTFTYSVADEHDSVVVDGCWEGEDADDEMEALRTILLIQRSQFDVALSEIKTQFAL